MNQAFRMGMVAFSVILLTAGCDTREQQDAFVDDAFRAPANFTRTDRDGRILSDDPDDWRSAPVYVGRVLIDPAYPNPTAGMFVSIHVSIREFNAVPGGLELAALDNTGRLFRFEQIPEARDPGAYVFTFNPTILGRRGLVRLFILDGRGDIVSYGDLQIE